MKGIAPYGVINDVCGLKTGGPTRSFRQLVTHSFRGRHTQLPPTVAVAQLK